MILKEEERTKLQLTLGQLTHEISGIYQSLETAPAKTSEYSYNPSQVEGYMIDEYLLKFRLGNVTDLAMHLLEVFRLKEVAR